MPIASRVVALACTACPGGTYSDTEGATSCTPCPEGTTGTGEGATACQPGGTTMKGAGLPLEVEFCNFYMPATMTGTHGQTSPQVLGIIVHWGLTTQPEPSPSIVAQVGYGPAGSSPLAALSTWSFFPAAFIWRADDHSYLYGGTFPLPTPGTYSYVYRFSIDGGQSYTYCDHDNAGAGSNGYFTFSPDQAGVLTVTP